MKLYCSDWKKLTEFMGISMEICNSFLKVYPSLKGNANICFRFSQKPWLSKGELLVGQGGLGSEDGKSYFLEFRVKLVGEKLSVRVVSEKKIYGFFLDKETESGDTSKASLIGFIEPVFGFASAGGPLKQL